MIDWQLIEKSLNHSLNEKEQQTFTVWLNSSVKHQEWYEKVKQHQTNSQQDYPYIRWRNDFERQLKIREQKKKTLFLRWSSIAALLVITLGWGILYYLQTINTVSPQKNTTLPIAYKTPDRNQIQLTLASGEIMHLSSCSQSDTTLKVDGVEIARHQGELIYQDLKQQTMHSQSINQIEVPRGAEFCLTLSDGSRVWLNSESTLSYPVAFNQTTREVTLQGEAYFQIQPDPKRPFVVQTAGMQVAVLGTEFNLNTRKKENIQTALVQGKIQIIASNGNRLILKPGQIAETDGINGNIQILKENILQHISWQKGRFYFEEANMQEIMNELALWYDVEVEFQNEKLRYETFSGYLLRGETIESILKKIEQTTYVHFQIIGKKIVIK